MNRREFLYRVGALGVSITATTGCTATRSPNGITERDRARRVLEANYFTTLAHLYLAADPSRALIAASEGVLIFPTVVSIGPAPRTEIGRGVLRVANVFTGYFHLVSSQEYRWEGSGSAAFIFAFTSFEALNEFRGSRAWPTARAESVSAARLAAMAGQARPRYPAVSALVLDDGAPTLAGLTVIPTEL